MTPIWLLAINMVLAGLASLVNLWAAWRWNGWPSGIRRLRGGLAAIYCGLYFVQVIGWLSRSTGGNLSRSLNIVTWVVVWTLPALIRPQSDDTGEIIRRVRDALHDDEEAR